MIRDVISAVRWLRKNPLFTVCATFILSLGIGATTAIFGIVDAVLLRPLPYEASGRLVRIDESSAKHASGVTATSYLRWQGRSGLFEKTVPYLKDTATLTGAGEPDQVTVLRTSGALFPLLGVHARMGRTLIESDDEAGSAKVAVISERLWRRRFHADPAVVGRAITISEAVFIITGVMPRQFEFGAPDVDLWIPLRVTPELRNWFQVVARLKPGITLAQATGVLESYARQLEQENPKENARLRIAVTQWSERPDRKYELTLVLVLVAVGLVLLIACADVGSLLLARAVQREREFAIRAALGAGRWRVVRQLLAESLVLASAGTAAGIAGAHYALQFLSNRLAELPIVLPNLQRVAINERVFLFNATLCALLVILCGLAPVVLVSRADIQSGLRGGGSRPRGSGRLFSVLIALEAAFACLLLVGSGLMIRSLIRLQNEDHGFRPENVLTMRVPVGMRTRLGAAGKYTTRPRQIAYYNEILQRIERVPGISAVAIVNNLPLSGVHSSIAVRGPDGPAFLNSTRTISPGYFAAMGIPVLAGRVFDDRDQAGSPGVAIINEYMARQLFPNTNPIGKALFSPEPNAPPITVVGVVKDTTQVSYDQPIKGEIYMPIRQFIFATFMTTIVVRTPEDPLLVAAALQKEVWAVDKNQPVVKVETMNEVLANSSWRPRFSMWIFSALGALALLLTSAGIYGVVAYTTSLRAREIGIRVALGATPENVIAAVLRAALVPISVGLAVGLLSAAMLSQLLASLLYEVRGTDPIAYVSAGLLLLMVAIAATLKPAWKAAAGDPLKGIRME